jgi:hypothetical protein
MKPKKERPSALPDSIFRARLGQASEKPEEIPVHNTFIQFGAPQSAGAEQKKPLSTAPAWIGPSFQSIIQQAAEEPQGEEAEKNAATKAPIVEAEPPLIPNMDEQNAEPFFAAEEDDSPRMEQERRPLGSPIRVKYALSSSSARAAGLPDWTPTSVAHIGPPSGFNVDDEKDGKVRTSSFNVDDEKDGKVPQNGESDSAEKAGSSRAAALGPIGPPGPSTVPSGPLPSLGSALHAEGACKRCCFFPKGRCQNGLDCEFCHFEHEKRKRKKKKKGAKARDANADGSESESEEDGVQGAGFMLPGAWPSQPEPIGSARAGLPLTAPPPLPPRGLPLPTEPPPPAPIPGLGAGIDPYYGGAYDLGAGGYGGILGGYGGAPYGRSLDGRPTGLGGVGINQSYFGGGYDPAAVAAQQQQSAYRQQTPGGYLPPPR